MTFSSRLIAAALLLMITSAPLAAIAKQLMLKGQGTRTAMFIELYTCEIFSADETAPLDRLLTKDLPVSINITVHGDTPGAMPDDWKAVIDAELNDNLMRRVTKTYRDLDAGDRVTIEYDQGQDTRVILNDELLFTDPGRGLPSSILDQWIGETPVSQRLKDELMGK